MSPVVRECKRQEVGILANLDDARNPPFEPYRDLLVDAGCSVTVHDPYVPEYPGVDISHDLSDVVRGADVVAILTGHDEYFSLDAGVLEGLMGTGAMRGRLGVCCDLGMMVEKYREKNNYI
jgi:UDP-N-acetyl-D-mannosaminuronic acid dehydrogenase